MKKINLFTEIIRVKKTELIKGVNSQKKFGINIFGEIVYEPYKLKEILIYEGKPTIGGDFNKILGSNYQMVDDGEVYLIKAFSNWQNIIALNSLRASYDDTTSDGVAEFANDELEDIGWNATEFDIKYRSLVEFLEENADGIVLCIEQEEPYRFSGLGFIEDDKKAAELLYNHCKNIIQEKMENDEEFSKENLTDDEEEAAEFFELI